MAEVPDSEECAPVWPKVISSGCNIAVDKARFQVVWVAESDMSGESDVGIECLEPEKDIWQTDLPEPTPDLYEE